jgi:predicted alpha-1,2-mannosidase
MVGTHIDAVVADAVNRGVTNFDVGAAFEGLLKHAYSRGDRQGSYGRIGIDEYRKLGFVPADRYDSAVARSLDYAYDDWCISQVAHVLRRKREEEALLEASKNYNNLWDPLVGFMRGKNADGSFAEPFDPITWGDPYVEGGPWQSSWSVPHDIPGLIELAGGAEAFVQKLESLLAAPPEFNTGSYIQEIHEMTEMACADFGQYAHSNQPVHHILYLFAAAGRPDLTRYWISRVMRELYTPTTFPGDEDNGEMSAWYVLNAFGIYPLTPGAGDWVFGIPRFDRATVHLPNRKKLTVLAAGVEKGLLKVEHILVDGHPWSPFSIPHEKLIQASRIEFRMG